MMIEQQLIIVSAVQDSLDIQPRGEGCHLPPGFSGHEFTLDFHGAGFRYQFCARCGTVRISERGP